MKRTGEAERQAGGARRGDDPRARQATRFGVRVAALSVPTAVPAQAAPAQAAPAQASVSQGMVVMVTVDEAGIARGSRNGAGRPGRSIIGQPHGSWSCSVRDAVKYEWGLSLPATGSGQA